MRWAALSLALSCSVHAQTPQPEARLDVLGPPPARFHAGGGLTWALGHYARVSAIASYGMAARAASGEWRGDLLARVTLDPFRQHRYGVSFGGGITVRRRPHLLAVAEVEGPAWGSVTPAVQGGLGNGARAGLVLRRTRSGRR